MPEKPPSRAVPPSEPPRSEKEAESGRSLGDLPLPREILSYYERGEEVERLASSVGLLEKVRTQELLERTLPPPPAVVLDVGGGPGAYACWLAAKGYRVHLVDPVPLHLEQARQAAAGQPRHPLAGLHLGDARRLDFPDASADAVLLLGPLYHLPEAPDRLAALREAARVLRRGAVLLAVAICRFASAFDGLAQRLLDDPDFRRIVRDGLETGRHRNPNDHPNYFTTAYFHRPEELAAEVVAAGLVHEITFGIEGPGRLLGDFDGHWQDPGRRQRLLDIVRALEAEPSLLGMSPHLMAVGRKPRE